MTRLCCIWSTGGMPKPRYVYRAVDQFGQVIDVFVSARAHHELAVEEPASLRVAVAFDELALTI